MPLYTSVTGYSLLYPTLIWQPIHLLVSSVKSPREKSSRSQTLCSAHTTLFIASCPRLALAKSTPTHAKCSCSLSLSFISRSHSGLYLCLCPMSFHRLKCPHKLDWRETEQRIHCLSQRWPLEMSWTTTTTHGKRVLRVHFLPVAQWEKVGEMNE